MSKLLIVGIGNDFRGDDGVGLAVVSKISQIKPDLSVHLSGGDVSSLMDWFSIYDIIILVDAMIQPSSKAGTAQIFDLKHHGLVDKSVRGSTHIMSIYEAVELARVLGALPDQLFLVGVVAEAFNLGESISDCVREKIDTVVEQILKLSDDLVNQSA